jgi:S-formylglutathione hydrolase FrmB
MGLTSGSFGTLMFVLAGASILLVVLLWPRASRRRGSHVLTRLFMIGLSQLLVIAAFLVYLNSYFGFYATWTQLLGDGQAPLVGVVKGVVTQAPTGRLVTVTGAEAAPAPGARIRPGERAHAAMTGERNGSGGNAMIDGTQISGADLAETGELLQVNIQGQHTGITVSNDYVYLPPQYFQPAYAHAKFPVLLALTGYPGTSWSVIARLKLPTTQEGLVAAGKIKPVVDVIMNSSVAMPRDTECTNIPAGPQVETFFAVDVPEAIDRTFRVQAGAGGWATLGYSTGGYCAVKIAMMYPRQFTLAVSMAGYYEALQDHTTGDLYGNNLGFRYENSPAWRLQHLPAPPISVLLDSSRIGENTFPDTVKFVALVKPPMQVYTLYLPQGGHNFGTWGRELPPSLIWLNQRFKPALPAGASGTSPDPASAAATQAGQGAQ